MEVRVMVPRILPETRPAEKVVLYLRMSDGDQVESIPSQRVELTKYARSKGYTILREYLDEAISGDATERRSGFLAMREAAGSGEFSVVLCWDQDRFGRFDPLDAGYWIYPFRRGNVRLETVAQGKIDWEDLTGQLVYSVNQLGKAQFLRDLSRNTTRGLLASAREGRAGTGGPSPYGLGSRDGKVWIVEDEAKVVRMIFALYLKSGSSLRGIAADLNRRKVPPPRGKFWRNSSIRAILQRRKYTGTFVYGARNAGKYFAMRDGEVTPRRKSDKTTSAVPIIHKNKFVAIVPQQAFDRVQRKLATRQGNTTRKQARQYLLSGLLKCGDCTGSMGGKTRSRGAVYHCRTYHQTGSTSCHRNTIEEAPLVACVVRKIQERYLSEPALNRLRKALEAAQDRTKPRPKDLVRLRREIEDLDRKIDQGAERVLEAPPEIVPALYHKLESWRSDRDRLRTDLEALTCRQARPERKDGSEIDQAISALQNLSQAFKEADPADCRELLSSIVTRIELHFHHEPTSGGRERSVFSHGMIYVRPDAGEARSADPKSSHLTNKGSYFETSEKTDYLMGTRRGIRENLCRRPTIRQANSAT
jgi:DNA invertase Pin-like site-specific DNA recombinase